MSDDPKPTALDARIDAVLRDVVRGEGPVDLRRRVLAELVAAETPSWPGWLGRHLVPALGVTFGLAVVAGLLILAWPGGAPPRTTVAVASPSATPVASPPAVVVTPERVAERTVRPGPRRPRADPPGWRSSELDALTLDQIEVPTIAWDGNPRPAELVLSDLDLPPVDVQTSQPLTNR